MKLLLERFIIPGYRRQGNCSKGENRGLGTELPVTDVDIHHPMTAHDALPESQMQQERL